MTKQHTKSGKFAPGNSLGSGRPPLPEGEQLITATIRINQAQRAWLKAKGISETIRNLIQQAMENES